MYYIFFTIPLVVVAVLILSESLLTPVFPVHQTGIVLITGASSGIGALAAESIASSTKLTVLAGVRKQSDLKAIQTKNISNLIPIMLDVTDNSMRINTITVVENIINQTGLHFVALINNAGMTRMAVAEYHSLDDIQRIFDTNFFGAVNLVQLFLPLLRLSKGRIIMISSVCGSFGLTLYLNI